ncbi:MAG: hypothetical protein HYX29_02285 [Solirubrobacterales bacterium]|nr:hypothetical protein [Solirubrobacterales bacterium]
MSEFEKPELKSASHTVTVDDVRILAGAATPHFSLQVRNRLKRLVAPLAADDPARLLAEVEIAKLERLAVEGERGSGGSDLARLNQS